MTWRKVLVRGLVFLVLGSIVLTAIVYRSWTNPAAVREQVISKLSQICTGAIVSVESAHLRLFGGIVFSDLRLSRRDDLTHGDFLYVPAGVIYHDKQQILDGNFAVRKCELNRLRLRLVRERDGRWNIEGLFATPSGERSPIPTLVIQQGTIIVEDRAVPGTPLVEIRDVELTVVNDPIDILHVQGSGQIDVAGPLTIQARIYRNTGQAEIDLDCTNIPVGPDLVQRVSVLAPNLAVHLRNFRGDARAKSKIFIDPSAEPMVAFDTSVQLHRGELTHAMLPLPLQQVEASFRCLRGMTTFGTFSGNNQANTLNIPTAKLSARSGDTQLSLDVEGLSLPLPASEDDLSRWQEHVRKFECVAENLWLTPSVWERMPEFLHRFRKSYKPEGLLTVRHTLERQADGKSDQEWLIQALNMTGEWDIFPYPVHSITGTLLHKTPVTGVPHVEMHVKGKAGESGTVSLDGTVQGVDSQNVDLVLDGKNITIDPTLVGAMNETIRAVADPYNLEGKVDVLANITRNEGEDFRNHYRITLKDGKVRYDQFPYPVEQARGVLDILPESWILHELRGVHKGGELIAQARSFPPEPSNSQIVQVARSSPSAPPTQSAKPVSWIRVTGKNVFVDKELERALTPTGANEPSALQLTWRSFRPSGRIDFVADIVDRPTPQQNLDVTVNLSGPTVKPDCFDLRMDKVSGRVRYYRDRVYLTDIRATHDGASLRLGEGQVFLERDGSYQVRIGTLEGKSIIPDEEFLAALPASLRKGVEALGLDGPLELKTALVFDPPAPGKAPVVWWDGRLFLKDAKLDTGVEWTGVTGQIWCRGRHDGEQLEAVVGGVELEKAVVLDQPLKNLRCRLEVAPDSPESLRFRHLTADFFDGVLGGEARIDFSPTFRYDLYVKALQVDLEKFGKHNGLSADAELQGKALGAIHLMGEGTDVGNLRGNGRLDVPNGKMYRLPLLLDVLKAFGLRVPDRTAFEQAHLTFGIEGTQMLVQDLDLIGNAISLRGRGSLNLDGSDLRLVFYTDWARMAQLLPPGITEIPRKLTDQLFQLEMRGRFGDVKYEKKFVPAVANPLERIFGID